MKRLIVIGGGFTGKLAAIIGSEKFKEVVVIEKRKCIDLSDCNKLPQQNHIHIILKQGLVELEKICKNISKELLKRGAIKYDMKKYFYWYHYGGEKYRYDGGYYILQQSRGLLEQVILEYLLKKENIKYLDGTKFTEFVKDDRGKLYGAKLEVDGNSNTIFGDVFVFATGTPTLTKKHIFNDVTSVKNEINLNYHSRTYTTKKEPVWKGCASSPMFPKILKGGVVLEIENNKYTVTLSEYGNKTLEMDIESISESLPNKEILNFINNAKSISNWETFSIPYTEFLEINKLKLRPNNIFVIGNGYCSFDPIFGQGLTVGALQCRAFGESLKKYNNLEKISSHYYLKADKIIRNALRLSQSESIQTQQNMKISNKIKHRVFVNFSEMSTYDKEIFDDFVSIMHFQKTVKEAISFKNTIKLIKHLLRGEVKNGK